MESERGDETYELSDEDAFSTKAECYAHPRRLLDAIPKGDHVERDVVLLELLELLCKAEERALRVRRGVVERRADKYDHALLQVLVPAVLECELCDHNRHRDRRSVAEVRRDLVDGFEDLESSLVYVTSNSGLRTYTLIIMIR